MIKKENNENKKTRSVFSTIIITIIVIAVAILAAFGVSKLINHFRHTAQYKGNVVIINKDDTGALLKDSTFELYDKDGELIKEYKTNVDGVIDLNLDPGVYSYKQTSVAGDYIVEDTKYEIELKDEKTRYKKDVINRVNDRELVIKTVDEDGKPVAGVVFAVYDTDENEIVNLTTQKDGKCKVTHLRTGEYYYIRTETPAGYKPDSKKYKFEETGKQQTVEKTIVLKK